VFDNPTVASLAVQIAHLCSSNGGPRGTEQILADLESLSDEQAQSLLAREIRTNQPNR
jgi:hypothetical protein